IDVGGTKVLGVALAADGTVVAEDRLPTPARADQLVEKLYEVTAHLDGLTGEASLPVGVGAPGLVTNAGEVLFAPNLPGAHELALHSRLADRLGASRHLVVDNDATCAGWGEALYGSARGALHAVVVTLG